MKEKRVFKTDKIIRNHLSLRIFLTLILLFGIISSWWIIRKIDNEMRKELLIQSRLVAGSINTERIKSLTKTDADIKSNDYLRLKKQLSHVRDANPRCHFVYLLGLTEDDKIFFYVDNEPIGSKNESPPGQKYEEASKECLKSFKSKTAITEGPVTDRWGTWVSSRVPIKEEGTGNIIAVLGIDFDATDWTWQIAKKAMLPIGLVLLALIMIILLIILRLRSFSLKQNEEKYRYLFEGAASGIAITIGDTIGFANPALERIIGHPIKKITSLPFVTFIHPEDKIMVSENYRRRMQNEIIKSDYDFRIITSDKTVKWVNIYSQKIEWGGLPASLSFISDISDRKKTEEKLTTMYEETNRLNRIMLQREDRVLELKKEVNMLSKKLDNGIVYKSVEE